MNSVIEVAVIGFFWCTCLMSSLSTFLCHNDYSFLWLGQEWNIMVLSSLWLVRLIRGHVWYDMLTWFFMLFLHKIISGVESGFLFIRNVGGVVICIKLLFWMNSWSCFFFYLYRRWSPLLVGHIWIEQLWQKYFLK